MADDDLLSKFTGKFGSKPSAKPTATSTPPPDWNVEPGVHGRQAYEAYTPFENEVRTTNVEIRCYRSGLSYFIPYAHMGVVVFNFRTGAEIYFAGGGYAVTIKGRNLRTLMMALRLHTCGTIQDFRADAFVLPQPEDPEAPFVESISVEVLTGPSKPRLEDDGRSEDRNK
jgi:hypothetical protein